MIEKARFEAERAAAAAAPLDEALAGIRLIAEASGLFGETMQASSISEVCAILASWCKGWERANSFTIRATTAGRVDVQRPDDGTYPATRVAFPEGAAVTWPDIFTAFEYPERKPPGA